MHVSIKLNLNKERLSQPNSLKSQSPDSSISRDKLELEGDPGEQIYRQAITLHPSINANKGLQSTLVRVAVY